MTREAGPEPEMVEIVDGWAAVGDGWAVFGVDREQARQRYDEAVRRHREIAARPGAGDCRVAGAVTTVMLTPLPPMEYESLDPGIRAAVRILRDHGIVTFESCEGGAGHCREEAFIKFGGNLAEAMYAMAVVLFDPTHGLRPLTLQQVWGLHDGFPEGPHWELTFYPRAGRALRFPGLGRVEWRVP